MSNWLQDLSWEEAKVAVKESKGVALIPVGSTEQHSYHLPLGTDTFVAITLAEEAAKKTSALITPPVWFGWSPHHMVLPGTLTIRPEVLENLVFDIIESLTKHGIDKFVLINGHRIVNVVWMQLAAQKAQSRLGCKVRIFDPAYMSKDIIKELGFGEVGHAEEIETSHMMAKFPDLVHLEKAVDNPIGATQLYSVDPTFEHDTLCYVPSSLEHAKKNAEKAGGATGEPSKADAKRGLLYHDHLIKNLVTVIKQLQYQE